LKCWQLWQFRILNRLSALFALRSLIMSLVCFWNDLFDAFRTVFPRSMVTLAWWRRTASQ